MSKVLGKMHDYMLEQGIINYSNNRSVSMYTGKYERLFQSLNLREKDVSRLTLSINEIEEILEFKLPASAYKYSAWWANESEGTHTHALAWLMAGWKTAEVIPGSKVTFIK
ncbi:hypothetical protein ABLO26_24565 [Neobacillus sp. 179-J 1A1 HS]|uniref:DUF7662 domain-containing protein n=1 Tax=Neobacillus driksii TaxID=3035913 RepID=UPI0035BBAF1B